MGFRYVLDAISFTSPNGDFSNEKQHNISYQVPTSSPPKSPSATSDNANIQRLHPNLNFCSQVLSNQQQDEEI
jgi:hypothetical protein